MGVYTILNRPILPKGGFSCAPYREKSLSGPPAAGPASARPSIGPVKTASTLDGATLPDSEGVERDLASFWADNPVVFVWLRHYG